MLLYHYRWWSGGRSTGECRAREKGVPPLQQRRSCYYSPSRRLNVEALGSVSKGHVARQSASHGGLTFKACIDLTVPTYLGKVSSMDGEPTGGSALFLALSSAAPATA